VSRLIAGVALATGTDPKVWDDCLTRDPRMFATVLDLMAERARRKGS
jgi:hypothetical protein